MRKLFALLIVSLMPALALASGGEVHLDKANNDLHNKPSLQRGAKYFMNYCMGCHATSYQRYKRMGADLGLSDELVQNNLILTSDFSKSAKGEPNKIGSLMTNAMPANYAKEWFGTPPPDLTLVARVRGVDWLYTYLRSFYLDSSRPFGVNNTAFPNVGMPHVLWQLQGWQEPVYHYAAEHGGHAIATFESKDEAQEYIDTHKGPAGDVEGEGHEGGGEWSVRESIDHLKLVTPGTLAPEDYDRMVRDLVNYLAYTAEPVQLQRKELGLWVLLFLSILFVVAYLLKKEYWKDVH